MVAEALAAHLTVRTVKGLTRSWIRVIKPHQCVFVLVQQAVFKAELLELIQPYTVVVHKGRIRRDQSHGKSTFSGFGGDCKPSGTSAND